MIKAEILPADSLGVDKSCISENALTVVETLQQAGFDSYLVGGCVRDLILDRRPKDFDVATSATPEQVKGLFRNSRIIGRRFKIVHLRFGREVIEVATFRANAIDREDVARSEMSQSEEGQLTRDNVYGTIEEDVMRRDFSANALYYDPVKNNVLDYVSGYQDIQDKQLRSLGEPALRFREDPVRMLRVIRFAAKLDFGMQQEAIKMIEEEGRLLSNVSPARLFDEVLKLFHGGAAFDTYKMLCQYGLFKYLFPFTQQYSEEDLKGMPELALQNTDKRIHAGKPVIPAFLFACMMWDPVKRDAQMLMDSGSPDGQAWRVAMNDTLRDQNQYVAVPKRLAEIIIDIWTIHFRLIKRNPRMIKASMGNRRFRAAYDFLLLRAKLHEVDEEMAEWWTTIQELEPEEQDAMIAEITETYKNNRKHQGGELNGNSVNYNQAGNDNTNYNRVGQNKPKRNAGRGRRSGPSNTRGSNSRSANGRTSNSGTGNAGPNKRNRRNRPAGSSRYQENSGSFDMPQPNDEQGHYGHQQKSSEPKVKIRRKRRIVRDV